VLFSYVDFDFILDPRFVSIGFWSYRFVSLFSAHIFCGQEFRFPIFQPGCPLESSPTSRRLPSVSEFCFSGGLSSQLRSWIRLPCGFLNSSGHCSALCPQLSLFARQLRFPVRQWPALPEFFFGFSCRACVFFQSPARAFAVRFRSCSALGEYFSCCLFSQVQAHCCLPLLALSLDRFGCSRPH
jgi:hypothetical protein